MNAYLAEMPAPQPDHVRFESGTMSLNAACVAVSVYKGAGSGLIHLKLSGGTGGTAATFVGTPTEIDALADRIGEALLAAAIELPADAVTT